jgi:hypothetical protein
VRVISACRCAGGSACGVVLGVGDVGPGGSAMRVKGKTAGEPPGADGDVAG